MNIMLVSQCSKRALTETRRVIDQFAERRGDRTWQTPITQQGLDVLRKLLKKSARRNTAVACHWIRSKNHTELLWVVGDQRKFNQEGSTPTNITRRNILKSIDENQWHTAEDMVLLSGIAALFHDFGKANQLFQNKIDPNKKGKLSEPYRHEWVSLRMFQAFVTSPDNKVLTDHEWLVKLSEITPKDEKTILDNLICDLPNFLCETPFKHLPPVAKTVAWLILTHHKLPQSIKGHEGVVRIDHAKYFLERKIKSDWNSPQISNSDWKPAELKSVWKFSKGSPVKSKTWCAKANRIAKRALNRPCFYAPNIDWLGDKYTLHLSRLALMIADHHYSSMTATVAYQDKSYKAFANSDRDTKQLKQKLDEHLIGVYKQSLLFIRTLPSLQLSLPAISNISFLKKRNTVKRFQWQDKAYDLAKTLAERSVQQGFFGVNMASTGKGKTLANARIMYGLANQRDGCRFSIALGLRTLTLQTGDALKERLQLADEDIAVLIGSQAVKKLYESAKEEADFENLREEKNRVLGSESANELEEENYYIQYEGSLFDGPLKNWLKDKPKLNKLLNAPILVSTIDHLMPATESARGGKQIAPMLRLLTSDLVLDEPDDFDIADLPALTRLVNWAGLLGARVLLSSATLPPSIIEALFASYQEGRMHFNKARRSLETKNQICCAWFDEYRVMGEECFDSAAYLTAHQTFVDYRASKLLEEKVIHSAKIVPVVECSTKAQSVVCALAETILENIYQLHQVHNQSQIDEHKNKKTISVGLVRMANINQLVAVSQQIAAIPARENHQLHLCIYHSQYPLLIRSNIEKTLDAVLNRNEPEAIWQQQSISHALLKSDIKQHIFVVLATSVAEVGRDHDYDWAIAEPSSMRSIIQLAGRIQRHRRQQATSPNLLLLNNNYKGLNKPAVPAYCKPGFETEKFKLNSHQLDQILLPEQYQTITSLPRIKAREPLHAKDNLVDLEHAHLQAALFVSADKDGAANWWEKPCDWTYQLQQKTPFRASSPASDYYLRIEDDEPPVFYKWHRNGEDKNAQQEFEQVTFQFADGVQIWTKPDYQSQLLALAEKLDQESLRTSKTFGAINLRDTDKPWCYSAEFGIYQTLY